MVARAHFRTPYSEDCFRRNYGRICRRALNTPQDLISSVVIFQCNKIQLKQEIAALNWTVKMATSLVVTLLCFLPAGVSFSLLCWACRGCNDHSSAVEHGSPTHFLFSVPVPVCIR